MASARNAASFYARGSHYLRRTKAINAHEWTTKNAFHHPLGEIGALCLGEWRYQCFRDCLVVVVGEDLAMPGDFDEEMRRSFRCAELQAEGFSLGAINHILEAEGFSESFGEHVLPYRKVPSHEPRS